MELSRDLFIKVHYAVLHMLSTCRNDCRPAATPRHAAPACLHMLHLGHHSVNIFIYVGLFVGDQCPRVAGLSARKPLTEAIVVSGSLHLLPRATDDALEVLDKPTDIRASALFPTVMPFVVITQTPDEV